MRPFRAHVNNGNMENYATIKELKKDAFMVKTQNTKQAIGIQASFIAEIKLQKVHFLTKYNYFLS